MKRKKLAILLSIVMMFSTVIPVNAAAVDDDNVQIEENLTPLAQEPEGDPEEALENTLNVEEIIEGEPESEEYSEESEQQAINMLTELFQSEYEEDGIALMSEIMLMSEPAPDPNIETGTTGGVDWTINNTTHTMSFSGTNTSTISGKNSSDSRSIWRYKAIEKVVLNGVQSIDEYSFASCNSLKTVEWGNHLENIGNYTFLDAGLTKAQLTGPLTTIGTYAFNNCTSLKSVTIPSTVTNIGEGAFYGCSGLENVTFSNEISEALTLGASVFKNCSSLKTIKLPKNLKASNLNASTFSRCYAMLICEADSDMATNFNSWSKVTFDSQGGTEVPYVYFVGYVGDEKIAVFPDTPTKEGYQLSGWYKDADCTERWNLSTDTVEGDITLFAKWDVPKSSSKKDSDSGKSSSSKSSSASVSQTSANTTTSQASTSQSPSVPSYTAPGKETVSSEVRTNANGTTTTVETHTDGTVQESSQLPATTAAAMNAPGSVNMSAPIVVKNVSLVIDKKDAAALSNEKVTTVVEASSVNGVVSITPQMVSNLATAVSAGTGTAASKSSFDIKVNTVAADGKPLSISVSSAALKSNAKLTVFAVSPTTGALSMVNAPVVNYNVNTGLVTPALTGGVAYTLVTGNEAAALQKTILASIKLSDTFSKPVKVAKGSTVDMRGAFSSGIDLNSVAEIDYSVSGNKAVIDPVTGILLINDNATNGTVTVTIKVTLKNGKTKTLKAKIKIG